MTVNITWLGHASFKITSEEGFIVYIDPWKLEKAEEADLILITHSHYDHLSSDDVKKIQSDKTQILVSADGVKKLKGSVRGVGPGESISIDKINLRTIPAYNIGKSFHPRENQWVGYILEMGGVSIYHAGDTDLIPEMEGLKPSVALLPIGGNYTMGVDEAVKAVDSIKPNIVIPMHYGDIVGSKEDARKFASQSTAEVKVIFRGEEATIG